MSRTVSSRIGLFLLVLGVAAHAAPAPIVPVPAPTGRVQADMPPVIADARRTPTPKGLPNAPYASGPIYVDVQVKNPSSKALDTELTVERPVSYSPLSFAQVAKVPVRIEPYGSSWLTYADPEGLRASCGASPYKVTLGTGAIKRVLLTPSCSFAIETVDPVSALPPDTRQAARANKLSYGAPSLTDAPTKCNQLLKVRAPLLNKSASNATGVMLRLDTPEAGTFGPTSPSVDVAAGGSSPPLDVGWNNFDPKSPGNFTLRVEGGNVPIYQPGWALKVSRACQVSASVGEWNL